MITCHIYLSVPREFIEESLLEFYAFWHRWQKFILINDWLLPHCGVWEERGGREILFIHLSVDPLVDMSWLLWILQVQICQGYVEHIGVYAERTVVLTLIVWGTSVPFHALAVLTSISNNSAQTSPLCRSLTVFLKKRQTNRSKMSQAFIFWFQSPCYFFSFPIVVDGNDFQFYLRNRSIY